MDVSIRMGLSVSDRGPGPGRQAAGLRHVVWSTLEDTRELLPLDDDRMPVLLGTYVRHVD